MVRRKPAVLVVAAAPVAAGDRKRLEHLCSYAGRSAIAEKRLSSVECEVTEFVCDDAVIKLDVVPGEPSVLWRRNRGTEPTLQGLPSDPMPNEGGTHSTMQATITFVK